MFFQMLFLLILAPAISFAQTWGTGMYGGMQSCPTPTQTASAVSGGNDETRELQKEITDLEKKLREKEKAKKRSDRDLDTAKEDLAKSVGDQYEDFVFTHIENGRRCDEYKSAANASATSPNANMVPVQSFSENEWNQLCDRNQPGSISSALCTTPQYREPGNSRDVDCREGLRDYRKNYLTSAKLQNEIDNLERDLERARENLTDAKQDALEEQKMARESGVCIDCLAKSNNSQSAPPQQTNWGSVVANLGTGLLATYMGYKQNEMVAEYNASIGYPTQTQYNALGYGYPYLQAGLYGAISGGTAQGAFNCGGSAMGNYNNGTGMTGMNGMGGAFGYPANMMGGAYGGGMYNMYGGGMNGMYGMNGMNGMNGMYGMNGMNGMYGMNGMNGMYGMNSASQYQAYQQQLYQSQMQALMARMQQLQYGTSYLGTGTLGISSSLYNSSYGLTPISSSTTPISSSGYIYGR